MRLRSVREYRVFDGDRRARISLTILILLVGYFLVAAIAV